MTDLSLVKLTEGYIWQTFLCVCVCAFVFGREELRKSKLLSIVECYYFLSIFVPSSNTSISYFYAPVDVCLYFLCLFSLARFMWCSFYPVHRTRLRVTEFCVTQQFASLTNPFLSCPLETRLNLQGTITPGAARTRNNRCSQLPHSQVCGGTQRNF